MKDKPPPIIIVSGGFGVSAELLVNTVLAQFPEREVEIVAKTYVLRPEELVPILDQAEASGGTLVHTLIDGTMRDALVEGALARGVTEIDLTSALIARVSEVLGAQPLGRPGRYRELRQDYFDRIAAIEYTISKDDGVSPDDWPEADIVLVGLSRVDKTPLSMYLAVNGWKVANVPIVHGMPIPEELRRLDRQRLFGLILDHEELLKHRRERQRGLGVGGGAYANERKAVAIGAWHACFIDSSFKMKCWGYGSSGQLGDGILTNDTGIPTEVEGLEELESMSVGEFFTCAIAKKNAYCWGSDRHGTLGNDVLLEQSLSPVPIASP